MPPLHENGDWSEYRRLVVTQLQELAETQHELVNLLDRVKLDVETLKGKQATRDKLLWIIVTALAGLVVAAFVEAVKKAH